MFDFVCFPNANHRFLINAQSQLTTDTNSMAHLLACCTKFILQNIYINLTQIANISRTSTTVRSLNFVGKYWVDENNLFEKNKPFITWANYTKENVIVFLTHKLKKIKGISIFLEFICLMLSNFLFIYIFKIKFISYFLFYTLTYVRKAQVNMTPTDNLRLTLPRRLKVLTHLITLFTCLTNTCFNINLITIYN